MHGGMEGKVTMWPWDVSGLGCTGMAPADLISRDSPMYLETLLLRASGGLVIHRTNFWNLCSKPGFPIVLSRIQRLLKEVPRATYYGLELSPFYRLNIGVPSNWHVETLLPNEMTWGGGAFGTCLGPKGGALIMKLVFLWRRPHRVLWPLPLCLDKGEVAGYEPQRGFSPESDHVGDLVLDFQPLELQTVHFCCL